MELSFRRFLESKEYPHRPGAAPFGGPPPDEMDHTAAINYEFGSTDRDQSQVSPYVGSAVQVGKTVLAGLPSFQVVSMNDKTVTVRVGDAGNKVIQRRKGMEDMRDPQPGALNGRTITIPRWQYERMVTRGLDQQGAAAPPMGI